ncbi:MAG: hypothetical protein PUK40_04125, partial [Actinomycetaceae bacterium]|nr:hypothetical protein [Actinomycetaceae bacterium]
MATPTTASSHGNASTEANVRARKNRKFARSSARSPRRGGSAIGRIFNNSIVNIVLMVVAVMWMVPTIGLF